MKRHRIVRIVVVLGASLFALGCSDPPIESLPNAAATIDAVGRRLGESLSIRRLSEFQGRGDKVLAALARHERHALGRNLVRFRLDSPALVTVAAPSGSAPFWLRDQGFEPVEGTIADEFAVYSLHRKLFPEGWVGLGVNALDDRAPAHYAVFVLSTKGSPGRDLERHPENPPTEPHTFRDLPDDLRQAILIRPAQTERTATALVKGRVWKTRGPSKTTPDQIVVSFGADAATTLGFNWRSRPEVAAGFVEIGEASKSTVDRFGGESEVVRSFGLLNDPAIRRHRVSVAGLAPDMVHRYRVGDGTPEGWSTWRTVRTGPRPGSFHRLMYLGDAQCGLEGWGVLLRRAVERHSDVGAILLAGDLVDRGNERSNWDHFFMRAEGVIDRVSFLPAVGNHEYLDRGPVHYRASFTLPENGPEGVDKRLVYSFEYGDVLVAVLDSNTAKYDPAQAKIQADWLRRTVVNSRATWRLTMFHHPVHASHPTRENPEIAAAWSGVLEDLGIDLVLQGHDHAYLRTFPMRGGRPASEGSGAPVYLVSVSGDKFCDQNARNTAAKGFTNVSTYQLLDVDPSRGELLYRAFDVDGKELDRLALTKKRNERPTVSGKNPVRVVR